MNTSQLLNLLLAAALVILSVKVAFFSDRKQKAEAPTDALTAASPAYVSDGETVLSNIMTRTSVRAYEDREVEEEKIEKMLQAAMAAPSAGNKQPWRFVVIKEKATLETISGQINTMAMAKGAALAVVVCGDMEHTFPGEGVEYWVQDASAATENLLLAAHAMGLGAVWCGVYPVQERVKYISGLLELPENVVPMGLIAIGYPAENPAPKDKWKPDNVHYERW